MKIINHFKQYILEIVKNLFDYDFQIEDIDLDIPPEKFSKHFHYSTNISMKFCKILKISPRNFAETLKDKLIQLDYIENIEIIDPGFINFKMNNIFFEKLLENQDISLEKIQNTEAINIEFVSANPTGPLHIGHMRGAIFGDVLARILEKIGHKITREYYINDAGEQINILVKSLLIRYKQVIKNDFSEEIPSGLYPGTYLIDTAEELYANFGEKFLNINENNEEFKELAITSMLQIIKKTLKKMGIFHDVFSSEQNIINNGELEKSYKTLKELDMIYQGHLEQPKGKEIEDWSPVELELIKTKYFGDDCDRPIKKRNGEWTYLAPDIAYHKNIYDRGFRKMILILGSDHKGYVKRLIASTKAVTGGNAELNIRLTELVNFVKNGENVKMSKRSGNFLTIDEVLEEIDINVLRFLFLTKKSDTIFNFDFELSKSQSKDNPIFYIQYAHARCCSVLQNATNYRINLNNNIKIGNISDEFKKILVKISFYEKYIIAASNSLEPCILSNYLIDLATEFHSLWSNDNVRFVVKNDNQKTQENLKILSFIRLIIADCLNIFGIKAIDTM